MHARHPIITVFASVLILTLLLTACTAPPPAATDQAADTGAETSAEPVDIQVYYPVAVDAPISEILSGYITEFEAENPDIAVEAVFSGGYGDVQTAVQTIIDGSGEPPALAVMLATSLYDLVNADTIVPLDEYINAMEGGEAWKFVEFMSRPERVADYSIQTGYIANRKSAFETDALSEYIDAVPQAVAAHDALQYAQAELSIQNLGQVRSILHNYLQQAFNGEMSAEDAMAAAQAEAEEALKPFCE